MKGRKYGFNVLNPALDLERAKRRAAESEMQKIKAGRADHLKARAYLIQFHLFELEESHYSKNHFTGEQKVMLGSEAKERNRRMRDEFLAHVNECIDKGVERTLPMRHWKLIERNVEPTPPSAPADEPQEPQP